MYGGEIGDEGEEGLKDLELYVDALRQAVVHRLYDGRDRRERDSAQGYEALESAEGNRDHLGIFRCTAHKDGAKEVFCMPTICRDKVRSRKKSDFESSLAYQRVIGLDGSTTSASSTALWPAAHALPHFSGTYSGITDRENVPEVRLAVTCSGEDLNREIDFSAAYRTRLMIISSVHRAPIHHAPRGLQGASSSFRQPRT